MLLQVQCLKKVLPPRQSGLSPWWDRSGVSSILRPREYGCWQDISMVLLSPRLNFQPSVRSNVKQHVLPGSMGIVTERAFLWSQCFSQILFHRWQSLEPYKSLPVYRVLLLRKASVRSCSLPGPPFLPLVRPKVEQPASESLWTWKISEERAAIVGCISMVLLPPRCPSLSLVWNKVW